MPIQPTISEKANKNYLAKIFLMQERDIKKHPNADRLRMLERSSTGFIIGLRFLSETDFLCLSFQESCN
mgnify:CR=1 FL=1